MFEALPGQMLTVADLGRVVPEATNYDFIASVPKTVENAAPALRSFLELRFDQFVNNHQ
jgi:hypothetical protein